MRRIKYLLEIGYCGCDEEGFTTVDDNMTNAEIDQMVDDMAHEHASSWEGDDRLAWNSEMSEEEYQEATDDFYANVCGSWVFVEGDEDEA